MPRRDARTIVLDQLREVAAKLEEAPTLYSRRLELFRRGKKLGITQREMGEAAGVGETAVIKALKRADAAS